MATGQATAHVPAGLPAPLPADAAGALARIRARLQPVPVAGSALWGWLGPLAVTGLAAFLRFRGLGHPSTTVFDEVYYAHDSWNLFNHGVELNTQNTAAGFVVHPPLGKWMMVFGEWIFGHNPYGWRFSAALFGTLTVLLLARLARRIFGSTLLGVIAGLLLAVEGLEFVQSRTGMLDIFLLFWLVAAFGCLALDRDDGRRRLAERLRIQAGGLRAGGLGLRPWRWAAGVCLGAATAVKWSGIWYLALFVALGFCWDAGARRLAGAPHPRRTALLRDTLPGLVPLIILPGVVYTLSWLGWFTANPALAWDHNKFVHPGMGSLAYVVAVVRGWISYHLEVYHFHVTLTAGHPYKSEPLSWWVLARPVAYFYTSPTYGHLGCRVATCSREILDIGTPAIWWGSIPAMCWLVWRYVSRRDWRAPFIVAGFAAGIVPWMAFPDRTMFLFYALPSVPFMVLALTYCAGDLLGGAGVAWWRRRVAAGVVGAYLVLAVANFFYLYPILSAQVIPQSAWQQRMWFTSCTAVSKNHTVEVAPCWI